MSDTASLRERPNSRTFSISPRADANFYFSRASRRPSSTFGGGIRDSTRSFNLNEAMYRQTTDSGFFEACKHDAC
jgi:hypothetical protein